MTFLTMTVVTFSLMRTADEEFPTPNDSFSALRSDARYLEEHSICSYVNI